ncbi:Zn-dependent exopeptidase [Jaminaea rosea]|uniref:Peptide hydrolase n=1 Tax=Jaminaea rosea TaxID=1569628 RepID=A0A316V129_9BASI|nr:Zn-dependent exopeptidase [Jaminaea rosea]PWN30251.1 Zn-dependent exopeptidase [Jaminaea rosea]
MAIKNEPSKRPLLPVESQDEKLPTKQASEPFLRLPDRLLSPRGHRWINRLIAASLAVMLGCLVFLPKNSTGSTRPRALRIAFSAGPSSPATGQPASSIYAQVPDYDGIATLSWEPPAGDVESTAVSTSFLREDQGSLIWLTREVVDHSLVTHRLEDGVDEEVRLLCDPAGDPEIASFARNDLNYYFSTPHTISPYVRSVFRDHDAPQVLRSRQAAKSLSTKTLVSTNRSTLLFVPHSGLATLDRCLPRYVRPYLLPPVHSTSFAPPQEDKPEPGFPTPTLSDTYISTWLRSPLLQSHERIQQDLDALTGENASSPVPLPGTSRWMTRHSSTYGGYSAARWLLAQQRAALGLEESGASESATAVPGARCDFWHYGDGSFNPNVVCIIPGEGGNEGKADEDEGAVVLTAHYDSRGSFGSSRAPGADDDGSGTAMLLALTRVLGQAISAPRSKASRRRPLHLILFSGEEQGLVGSSYYAAHLRKQGVPIRLALQTDMIAYRVPGEAPQLASPTTIGTKSAATFVQRTAQLWAPELVVGKSAACCSDHQSFWQVGAPATSVFERNGPIADPMYHESGDVSRRRGYDVGQLVGAGKVVLAAGLQLLWE